VLGRRVLGRCVLGRRHRGRTLGRGRHALATASTTASATPATSAERFLGRSSGRLARLPRRRRFIRRLARRTSLECWPLATTIGATIRPTIRPAIRPTISLGTIASASTTTTAASSTTISPIAAATFGSIAALGASGLRSIGALLREGALFARTFTAGLAATSFGTASGVAALASTPTFTTSAAAVTSLGTTTATATITATAASPAPIGIGPLVGLANCAAGPRHDANLVRTRTKAQESTRAFFNRRDHHLGARQSQRFESFAYGFVEGLALEHTSGCCLWCHCTPRHEMGRGSVAYQPGSRLRPLGRAPTRWFVSWRGGGAPAALGELEPTRHA
jgi:hypothetical protein